MAHTTITGNLTKDPELKQSQQGKPYARFTVAWSERVRDAQGNYDDGPTVFVSVTCFGSTAENVCLSLQKGNRVDVTGQLTPDLWQKDTGPETVFRMTADKVSPSLQWHVARPEKPGQHESAQQFAASQGAPSGSGGDVWNSAPQGGFGAAQDDSEPPF